jgi:hypothetical protein
MKKMLLLLSVFFATANFAQRKIVRNLSLTTSNKNLFDAVPGYRKAPIAFVPFTAGADAAKKGYKADSIYIWTDPAGKRHRATGAEILQQVNEVEKSLCERGHSFRHSNTFDGLKATVPRDVLMNGIPNLPANFVTKKSGRIITAKFNGFNNRFTMGGTIYPYLGTLQRSAEFPGSIYDVQKLSRLPNDASSFSFPLILAAQADAFSKLAGCVVEIYSNAGKTGLPLFSIPLDIKKPAVALVWPGQLQNNSANTPAVTSGVILNNYTVTFKNSSNKIPAATRDHNYYYIGFKFTGTDGKPLIMSVQNDIAVDNSLTPPLNIAVYKEAKINNFNFEVTDPVKHCFGMYARSNGFNAKSSSEPFGFVGQNKKSSFDANLSIGARYYNFEHLVNSNASLTNDLEIVGFNFSAAQNYNRPDRDNLPPPIRIPGNQNLLTHANTKLEFRVLGEVIGANETAITQEVFNQRFFIGPVPCKATVSLTGKAGITASGTYTQNTCDMAGKFTPYAELNVTGSGGVDALIAYAIVEVNVNLLKVGLPIEFEIDNPGTASVQSSIEVSGLSGNVNFRTGFCIPIPFFDDICKDFTIEIFRWNGLNEKYAIDNAGIK